MSGAVLRPGEVLDCRIDLTRRITTPEFRGLSEDNFMASWQPNNASLEGHQRNAKYLTDSVERNLGMAHLYRVTPDMVDLLLHAASTLDESDTFDRELQPTSHGLVHFAKPIPVRDLRGDVMLAHWMLWGPIRLGYTEEDTFSGKPRQIEQQVTLMTWWNDGYLQPDVVWERLVDALVEDEVQAAALGGRLGVENWVRKIIGRWNWIGADYAHDGTPVGAAVRPVPQDALDHERELLGPDTPLATETTNLTRVAHTLWLMLNQTVTAAHDEPVERHAVKRAERARIDPRVTVVQLRRERVAGQTESQAREWRGHWIVRGFWRWQAYGPRRTERRRIWIAPFVKGDLSKPLIGGEKLYSLER